MGIADDDWFPSVGMQFGSLQLLLKESLDEAMDRRVIIGRDTVYSDKSAALDYLGRPYDSHLFCLLLEELRGEMTDSRKEEVVRRMKEHLHEIQTRRVPQ